MSDLVYGKESPRYFQVAEQVYRKYTERWAAALDDMKRFAVESGQADAVPDIEKAKWLIDTWIKNGTIAQFKPKEI